jgi:hypothetical protein
VIVRYPHLEDALPVGPRQLVHRLAQGANVPRFSICVMVTDWGQYAQCLASYRSHGFDEGTCEFLVLDNSDGNRADAFVAFNEFLQAARGEYVVVTHQDVTLIQHGRPCLEQLLGELTERDPFWAVCGNAGMTDDGRPVLCLSHPHKDIHIEGGPFPTRVVSLDENFIVVRALANLALSRDLAGFHHYGADLCTIAEILGWRAYVIGFFLRHHSGGTVDERYERSLAAIGAKYCRAVQPRWVHLITFRRFYIAATAGAARRARWKRFLGKVFGRVARRRGSGG